MYIILHCINAVNARDGKYNMKTTYEHMYPIYLLRLIFTLRHHLRLKQHSQSLLTQYSF